jgi:hypothetical protein
MNNLRCIHFIILGILADGPKHGYQIHKELNDPEGIGAVWKIKITNIYGLLDVLEKGKPSCLRQRLWMTSVIHPKSILRSQRREKIFFKAGYMGQSIMEEKLDRFFYQKYSLHTKRARKLRIN